MKIVVAIITITFLGCNAQLSGDDVESIEVTASPSAPQCVFPFTYNGKEYTECVTDDSLLGPWCATVANYTGDSSFRYCTVKDMGIETTSVSTTTDSATESVAKDCVFPFTYAGVQYAQCTDVDSITGRPWCATASEYSSSEWRFCSEDEIEPACVLPFTYNDKQYSSCTSDGSSWGKTWCPTSADYPETNKWKYCTAAEELVTASGTGPKCVFPFTYNGVEYTECTDVDVLYGTWCATTDDLENNPDMWMRC